MMLEIIRRIDTQTDKHLQKELCRDIKRVAGKVQLLFRVAEAVVEEPEGTIRAVLSPRVKEETFRGLAVEARASGAQYRSWYHYVMRQKYGHHYRQMLPLVLDHLAFRSENRFQPVIEALAVLKQYLGAKGPYFPADEAVPLDGVVLPSWRDTILEEHEGKLRINLGGVRLMPRLKRLKYERLYLPETGMAGGFPNLAGVLSRPMRWDLIAQQYDEMVKHAVALQLGTATPEAILRRFNSYNLTHPTYKALAELGKAVKTIYLCEYLSSLDLRYEVNEGLTLQRHLSLT